MQDILDLMKKLREPGVVVDVSIDLIKQLAPAERETFVRKMMEDFLPEDLPPEQHDDIVVKFLSLIESGDFEGFADQELKENNL